MKTPTRIAKWIFRLFGYEVTSISSYKRCPQGLDYTNRAYGEYKVPTTFYAQYDETFNIKDE
jgi:hypothetical protein